MIAMGRKYFPMTLLWKSWQ